jgi:hypothetical protein
VIETAHDAKLSSFLFRWNIYLDQETKQIYSLYHIIISKDIKIILEYKTWNTYFLCTCIFNDVWVFHAVWAFYFSSHFDGYWQELANHSWVLEWCIVVYITQAYGKVITIKYYASIFLHVFWIRVTFKHFFLPFFNRLFLRT